MVIGEILIVQAREKAAYRLYELEFMRHRDSARQSRTDESEAAELPELNERLRRFHKATLTIEGKDGKPAKKIGRNARKAKIHEILCWEMAFLFVRIAHYFEGAQFHRWRNIRAERRQ
jgi:hypothetical protein